MIQFVQSIWLWAITAIAVPLFIHLWNVKQGKTLKVGSIAWLSESARSHAKSLRVSDLLLLIIRCCLLILLAFLVAKPFLVTQDNSLKEKGWILVERSQMSAAHKSYGSTIDSLLQQGFVLHEFKSGFRALSVSDSLHIENSGEPTSYWHLLRELDQQVPAKLPLYVFTDNALNHFSGTRPSVALDLHWKIFPADEPPVTWIQSAYVTTKDSIAVIMGKSQAKGTSFTHNTISRFAPDKNFSMVKQNPLEIGIPGSANSGVIVDTASFIVCIYLEQSGANYIRAALEAIRSMTQRKIDIRTVNNLQGLPPKYDWLFWLSEKPIPKDWMRGNVFRYNKGRIVEEPVALQSPAGNEELLITQSVIPDQAGGKAIWTNGSGNAVLQKDAKDSTVYLFNSRFDPQWNNLVWSPVFPQMIYKLLFASSHHENIMLRDKRAIDPQQAQVTVRGELAGSQKTSLLHNTDLSLICWLLAFVLFFIERLLTYQKSKEVVYA